MLRRGCWETRSVYCIVNNCKKSITPSPPPLDAKTLLCSPRFTVHGSRGEAHVYQPSPEESAMNSLDPFLCCALVDIVNPNLHS